VCSSVLGGGGRPGRYAAVAAGPVAVVPTAGGEARVADAAGERALPGHDPLAALERYLAAFAAEPVDGLPVRFCGGAVGYLAYEAARYVERVPLPAADPLGVPDGVFLVTDTLACFDHVRHRLKLVSHVRRWEGETEAAYRAA